MCAIAENSLSLRAMTANDLSFLFQVYASTRLEEITLTGWDVAQSEAFLNMQFTLQHTQWQQRFPHADFDLILLKEKPVGRLYINRTPKDIHIIDIAILPEYRGQGIGSFLIKQLIAEARQKDLKLSLNVLKTNPVQELYRRLGFKHVQEDDVYAAMEITAD